MICYNIDTQYKRGNELKKNKIILLKEAKKLISRLLFSLIKLYILS